MFGKKIMEDFADYYAILGVDTQATPEAIKKAFKHLALRYHPDVYKGEDAEARMREILLAYQTLIDPERRHNYDLSRARLRGSARAASVASEAASSTRSDSSLRFYAFPPLNDGLPAQIDLGEITYLLSASEARRLKEDGMLRGKKIPSASGTYYCHRCRHHWQAAIRPTVCPRCKARDWSEYLLLRCQHCHAVFESEQIRYEVGSFRYGDGALCPPYELFPLCPHCGKAKWCPAEEERLWNVRDKAERREKWRRRFGLK